MGKFILTLAFLSCAVAKADASALDGWWSGTVTAPGGFSTNIALTLRGGHGRLTGFVMDDLFTSAITNGKVAGNELTFNVTYVRDALPCKARLVGSALDVTIVMLDADFHGTLKRLKDGEVAPVI